MTDHSVSWRATFVRYAPLILWIGVIFYFSTTGGSMEHTSRFIRPLLQFLFPAASEETITLYHGYVRKLAHFSEYAVLAFLAVRAMVGSPSAFLRRNRFILPVLLAAAVAISDEVNQSMEASRTGSIWDVLLDLSGALAMVIALYLLKWPRLMDVPDPEHSEATADVRTHQP